MKSEMELLLAASLKISRMEREAKLSAAAITALHEELADRDRELLRLRQPHVFKRDQTIPALLRPQAG